jgi:chromosome segregation ATPase
MSDPGQGQWETRFNAVDAALAAITTQLNTLKTNVTTLQQQETQDLTEQRANKAELEAKLLQQQQALTALATQLTAVRTEEAAAEQAQNAQWQTRFEEQQQSIGSVAAQVTAVSQAVGVLQEAEVEQAQTEQEREERWEERFRHQEQSMGAIFGQLVEVRKGVDVMQAAAQEANLRRRLELVPVRVGDLMRGFQSAVSRANRSTRAGEGDGDDIAQMAIKDLEVSLQAPVIEGGHAEDPTLMLPNIKSVDRDTASVTIKFSVVTLPAKQR